MTIQRSIDAFRAGHPVLAVDGAETGYAFVAAHEVTTAWIAWAVRYTDGFLSAAMPPVRADHLDLPPMVPRNRRSSGTWRYTVSVDCRTGVTTGISAADRARTFRALASVDTTAGDLVRPGHVLPISTHPGGLSECLAAPEAAVHLCLLANLPPVAVVGALFDESGNTLSRNNIDELASAYGLPVLTIDDLADNSAPRPLTVAWSVPQASIA